MLTLEACNQAENYQDAHFVLKDKRPFIKLRGKRNLMSHDFVSLFNNKTYEDSVLIPVPSTGDKRIPGREIVFDNGYNKYSYDGYVLIKGKKLSINFYYSEKGDKTEKKYFYVWNGDYVLHRGSTK
ncbi:hypothetical protein [Mucilaginibacter sp.]|uniref:hypothetical protein n=2 Tax=Mucilaginibacter sp. TaxID=1882438 RepID=UPI003264B24E